MTTRMLILPNEKTQFIVWVLPSNSAFGVCLGKFIHSDETWDI